MTGQNLPVKCCQHLEIQYTRKRIDLLMLKNFGSVGQKAAKVLAVKVGVLKKKSAASAIPLKVCASAFCPRLSTTRVESLSKFDSQQL